MVFVSYSYAYAGGHGFGMCEADFIPETLDDVRRMATLIEDMKGWPRSTVIVINWKTF